MAILIVAEHDNATLSDQTAKALSAAAKIGGDVDILVAGKGAKAAADAAARLKGVRKVLLAESDELENRLAEPLAATVVALADGYDTLIAPATTMGKNVMPRIAALLDVMQLSDVIEVVDANHMNRGELYLKHRHEGTDLQVNLATDTLRNLATIWSRPVHIETEIEGRRKLFSHDGNKHGERTL